MKYKNKGMQLKAFLAILTLLVIVSGCTGGGENLGGNAFIGGTKGLEISFIPDSPPAEAFDSGQRPFDATIQLKNVGEFDINREDIVVKISGLSPNDFGVLPQDMVKRAEEDLAKTQKDPSGTNKLEGGITTVTFANLRYLPVLSGPTTFPVRADVCYKYGTYAETTMCVKENPLNTRESSVCIVNEDKPVDNSGAPIHVTSFKEFGKARDQIGFTFTISQAGTGLIFRPDSDCNAGIESIVDENKVFVNIDTRLPGLKCTGLQGGGDTSGYTVLYGGTGSSSGLARAITCTQPLPDRTTAFLQQVRITLTYDYKEFIREDIVIKHG